MLKIQNPILKGFNPDPSILRVGDDYYIATSTFEWFPGVMVYHSRDLMNWNLIARPLNRLSQLNMLGNPSSCGVWAPCLTYCDGIFYLAYTDVKVKSGIFKDTHNYLVTASDIRGDWSEPIYLNSSGFDPSLFHDEDGRKYLVNMLWDHRPWKNSFAGIVMQEYSLKENKLVGEVINIFKGTNLGKTEGPHIYKRKEYYYLMVAEGGTEWNHAVTVARSKKLNGPYEVDPLNPILTSSNNPEVKLKKAGHASLVETKNGKWYISHLCARPLQPKNRCVLGRETAIQEVYWTEDGWLRLVGDISFPQNEIEVPFEVEAVDGEISYFDNFDVNELNPNFQTLRVPIRKEYISLEEKTGYLTLRGGESLSSHHNQSLIARRQQSFTYEASTCLEFNPITFQQMAGLISIYDTINFYYLHISYDDEIGKCLNILVCDNGDFYYPLKCPIKIDSCDGVYLKVIVEYNKLSFFFSYENKIWNKIGPSFDASTLSDEYYGYINQARFTGAFIGMCCQDMSGCRIPAYFDYFEYKEV